MIVAATTTVAFAQVYPCGGDMTDVEVQLYPTSLTVGKDASIYLSYNAPYEVTSGTTKTTFNFNGVPYPEMDGALCSDQLFHSSTYGDDGDVVPSNVFDIERYYQLGAVACPIIVGIHSSNDSFAVPNMDGELKSKVEWFSESGTLLLCLKFLLTIEDAPAAAADAIEE
jgi:hypothetical protein